GRASSARLQRGDDSRQRGDGRAAAEPAPARLFEGVGRGAGRLRERDEPGPQQVLEIGLAPRAGSDLVVEPRETRILSSRLRRARGDAKRRLLALERGSDLFEAGASRVSLG